MSSIGKIPEHAAKNTHQVAASLLPPAVECRRVLDIPCGSGAFTHRLMEQGREVYSVDYSKFTKAANPRFVRADMSHALPFQGESFDAVACLDGIEHIEKPVDFIRECGRVLRKDGVLLLTTPNISSLRSRWRYFLTGFHNKCKTPLDETNPTPWHHISMVSYPELRYRLHANGFKISRVATNRVKLAGWLYLPFTPLAFLASALVFRMEKEARALPRPILREVLRDMFSVPVLFGEALIIVAKKD